MYRYSVYRMTTCEEKNGWVNFNNEFCGKLFICIKSIELRHLIQYLVYSKQTTCKVKFISLNRERTNILANFYHYFSFANRRAYKWLRLFDSLHTVANCIDSTMTTASNTTTTTASNTTESQCWRQIFSFGSSTMPQYGKEFMTHYAAGVEAEGVSNHFINRSKPHNIPLNFTSNQLRPTTTTTTAACVQ